MFPRAYQRISPALRPSLRPLHRFPKPPTSRSSITPAEIWQQRAFSSSPKQPSTRAPPKPLIEASSSLPTRASDGTLPSRPSAPVAAPSSPPAPLTARLLGYGGVLPFAASAVATAVPELHPVGLHCCHMYGASILSFLGAVHWGVALSESAARQVLDPAVATRVSVRDLGYSVTPSLVAFGAAVLPVHDAFAVLVPSFVGVYVYDAVRFGGRRAGAVPPWYMVLRRRLTGAAVTCMAFCWAASGPISSFGSTWKHAAVEPETEQALDTLALDTSAPNTDAPDADVADTDAPNTD